MNYHLWDGPQVFCLPDSHLFLPSALPGKHLPSSSIYSTGHSYHALAHSTSPCARFYVICGIFLWIVNLSDLPWHRSLHKLAFVFSLATCHTASCTWALDALSYWILGSFLFPLLCGCCSMYLEGPPSFVHLILLILLVQISASALLLGNLPRIQGWIYSTILYAFIESWAHPSYRTQ